MYPGGATKFKGLLDAENEEEFEDKWKILANIWNEKGKPDDKFLEYMIKSKKDMMKTSMVVPTWEKCGLGKPPAEYTQTFNKSINSMLKKSKGVSKLRVKGTV